MPACGYEFYLLVLNSISHARACNILYFCFTCASREVICIKIAKIVISQHVMPVSKDLICIKIVNMNRYESS